MQLNETIQYKTNLPFSAQLINLLEEPAHCHKEVEILLILRGFLHYKIYHMDYFVREGDVIIADVEDLHRIHQASPDVLALQLHIDTARFEEIYPNICATYFVCEAFEGNDQANEYLKNKQDLLKHQLAKLVIDYYHSPSDFVLQTENINDIVGTMIQHFRGFYMENHQYRFVRQDVSNTDLERMSRITQFLLTHYDKKISLEDIASKEHLNPYYVSHLIKKTIGFHFQDFINAVRLEYAEKALLFTNATLTEVSRDCGFSSPNYFNKCFLSWYGISPSQYRKDQSLQKNPAGKVEGNSFFSDEALSLISRYISPLTSMRRVTVAPSEIFSGEKWMQADSPRPFCPMILLDTPESIIAMGFYKERILSLDPRSLMVHHSLLTQTVKNSLDSLGIPILIAPDTRPEKNLPSKDTTTILASLVAGEYSFDQNPIPLIAEEGGLLHSSGLPTPLYTSLCLLKQMNPQQCGTTPYMIQSWDNQRISMLFFNDDLQTILNVSIETKNLPEQFVLIKRQVPEENNCYALLKNLKKPVALPGDLIKEMDSSIMGTPVFTFAGKHQLPLFDFIVYPRHTILLEIVFLS